MGIALVVFGILLIGAIIIAIITKDAEIFGFNLVASIIIGGTALAVCVGINTHNKEYADYEIDSMPIYSLDLSSKTSGSFIFGSGMVNTDFVYVFYDKDDDDYLVLYYVKASQTRIKTDDSVHPCIKTYVSLPTNCSWWTGFGTADLKRAKKYAKRRYEIYVPSDAIVEHYNIYP